MTENGGEISFILVNDKYNPFSFAIHEWHLMRLSGKSSSH